jgi:hypothetical protein
MKKVTFFTLFLSFFLQYASFSQKSMMVFQKGTWGAKYEYLGQTLSQGEAGEKFQKENPEAYEAFKKARTANVFSTSMGFVGGALFGWEIGSAISSKPINYVRGGIGLGVGIIGFIIDASAVKNFKKAADIYNGGKGKSSFINSFQLNLKNPNEVGLCFHF